MRIPNKTRAALPAALLAVALVLGTVVPALAAVADPDAEQDGIVEDNMVDGDSDDFPEADEVSTEDIPDETTDPVIVDESTTANDSGPDTTELTAPNSVVNSSGNPNHCYGSSGGTYVKFERQDGSVQTKLVGTVNLTATFSKSSEPHDTVTFSIASPDLELVNVEFCIFGGNLNSSRVTGTSYNTSANTGTGQAFAPHPGRHGPAISHVVIYSVDTREVTNDNGDNGTDNGNGDNGTDNGNGDNGDNDNGDNGDNDNGDNGTDNGDNGTDNGDNGTGNDNDNGDNGTDNGDNGTDNGDNGTGNDNGNGDNGTDNGDGNGDNGTDNGDNGTDEGEDTTSTPTDPTDPPSVSITVTLPEQPEDVTATDEPQTTDEPATDDDTEVAGVIVTRPPYDDEPTATDDELAADEDAEVLDEIQVADELETATDDDPQTDPAEDTTEVLGVSDEVAATTSLPRTGSSTTLLTLIGALLALAGLGLLRQRTDDTV